MQNNFNALHILDQHLPKKLLNIFSNIREDVKISIMSINIRKKEHIEIIQTKDTSSNLSAGFNDILLVPKTLPELNLNQISTEISFLGKKLAAPLLISSMTGGTEEATEINARLAKSANKFNVAISVGSQKAMIKHPNLASTYEIRKYAPNVLLIGNIGIDYLLDSSFDFNALKNSLERIGADALFIHLNPVQEIAQPEGINDFRGSFRRINELRKKLKIPILIKEVGSGIDSITAKHLQNIGVYAIDVAGSGGTSWAAVESYRGSITGEAFRDWGIPTCASLILCKKAVRLPLIASGGVRTGQDIAKSIVLGAKLCGIAKPFLINAIKGQSFLDNEIEKILTEFKTAMLLVGARHLNDLQKTKYSVHGLLKEYLEQVR